MVENIASACLGAIVIYIAMYFVTRFTSYTPKVLSALLSVILGGAVVAFLGKMSSVKTVFSYYAIGLAIGLLLYIALYWIKNYRPPAAP
jgi:hypothetical protein